MAYTTINKSSEHFNTKLYTGNGSAGNAITGVGFQPDFVWIKDRDTATNHMLTDAVRGATKTLHSQNTDSESTAVNALSSFNTDGFTVNTDTDLNANNKKNVAWNWKAGTSVSGNTGGSGTAKSYSGSVNTTAGFSIIKYFGNATNGHTIPHHLGAVPKMILVKRTNDPENWQVYHASLGATKFLYLDTTAAVMDNANRWYDTTPSSSYITLGSDAVVNGGSDTYIAYCFAEKTGYSNFGSYVGNGNNNGTFVYTGFKPAFTIIKNTTTAGFDWVIDDVKRSPFNEMNNTLFANENYVEYTGGAYGIDYLSNGFKIRDDHENYNKSGDSYIYMAFAEAPLVGTNNVPATAR